MILPKAKISFTALFWWGIGGIVLLIVSTYVSYSVLPNFLTKKLWENKVLIQGTQQWDEFIRMPFLLQFKVYLFTVANPADVLEGAKPILEERGPYVYQLQRWKNNITWNETNDELTYYEYDKYEFDQEASGNRSDQDEVTILNLPYLSLVYVAEMDDPNLLQPLDQVLETIFQGHGLFLTKVKVKDYLFDGITMCKNGGSDQGFLAKTVCGQVKRQLAGKKQMRLTKENDILFATFHYRNNTHQGQYSVKSGGKNRTETGLLTKFNQQTSIHSWTSDDCNNIVGGITSVFPTNLDVSFTFRSFSEDICRYVSFEFAHLDVVDGVKGYQFTALNTTFSYEPKESWCYCINKTYNIDGSSGCLYDGVLDLFSCQGNKEIVFSERHMR